MQIKNCMPMGYGSKIYQNPELFRVPLPCLQALAIEDRSGPSSVLHWAFRPLLSRDLGLAVAVYILAGQATISMTNYLSENSLRQSVPCEPVSTLHCRLFLHGKELRACKLTSNFSLWICFLFQISILPQDSTKVWLPNIIVLSSTKFSHILHIWPEQSNNKKDQGNQGRSLGFWFWFWFWWH